MKFEEIGKPEEFSGAKFKTRTRHILKSIEPITPPETIMSSIFDKYFVWSTTNGHIAMRQSFSPRPWNADGSFGQHWWLFDSDDKVTAYCKTIKHQTGVEKFFLSEIEVRLKNRGQGLTRAITRLVSQIEDATLYSSGGWTEDGAKALHFLPIAGGFSGEIVFRKQSFVKDWDSLTPNYA